MKSSVKRCLTWIRVSEVRTKTVAVLLAVAAAVVLPQLVHIAGVALGAGTGIGAMLLPMHLPVLFVGCLMGPAAGVAAGCLSPLVSYVLTGMPMQAMLPFIVAELMVYGLVSGWMSKKLCKPILKVLIAQTVGRMVRSAMVLASVYLIGNSALTLRASWSYITAGVWGIAIQLLILPVLLSYVEKKRRERGI